MEEESRERKRRRYGNNKFSPNFNLLFTQNVLLKLQQKRDFKNKALCLHHNIIMYKGWCGVQRWALICSSVHT